MSIRKIIDWAIQDNQGSRHGLVASPFYQMYDLAGNWVWACDIDIGEPEVLRSVAVAFNNREIIYAEQGKGVMLTRLNNGKWVISGLSKTQVSTVHYIYMSFADDMFEIVDDSMVKYTVRALTYGELADYGGYGVLPYGAQGKFDYDGNFIKIMGWPS